jgi:uncharacterized protein (UPF0332 family)
MSSDLLAQARNLSRNEPKKPKQASLRRSISAAYYALFHLLTEEAANVMCAGGSLVDLRAVVRRAFEHTAMKNAAKGFGAGNPTEVWKSLLAGPSTDLQRVARTFVDLQEARAQADYDLSRAISREEAVDLVERVESAFKAWKSVRKTKEARIFLTALLIHDRVSKR